MHPFKLFRISINFLGSLISRKLIVQGDSVFNSKSLLTGTNGSILHNKYSMQVKVYSINIAGFLILFNSLKSSILILSRASLALLANITDSSSSDCNAVYNSYKDSLFFSCNLGSTDLVFRALGNLIWSPGSSSSSSYSSFNMSV